MAALRPLRSQAFLRDSQSVAILPTTPHLPAKTSSHTRTGLIIFGSSERAACKRCAGRVPSTGKLARGDRAQNVAVVVIWYLVNTALIITNKYLLVNHGFRHPITLMLLHMAAISILTASAAACGVVPHQPLTSRSQLSKVFLVSIIFTLSIVCGNVSLRYIPISFNQAVGSCTPVFTALFALLLQGKRESTLTYLTLVPVVAGVVIAANFEPSFHTTGFQACVAATALRGLKTVVQAALLSHSGERLDSMNLLLRMAPIAFAVGMPAAGMLEPDGWDAVVHAMTVDSGARILLVVNSLCAFLANALNFIITQRTSALTLQVLGNVKSVASAIAGVAIFSNPLCGHGIVGFLVSVIGSIMYGRSCYRDERSSKDRQVG